MVTDIGEETEASGKAFFTDWALSPFFLLQGELGATAGVLFPKGKQHSFGGSPENEWPFLAPHPSQTLSLQPAVPMQIAPHHLHLVHLVPLFVICS